MRDRPRLSAVGLSAILGANAPVCLKASGIYRPLFWAELSDIPFGVFLKPLWMWLYLFGILNFLAPVLALFTIFRRTEGSLHG
jgi:hypothetical protein